MSPRFTDWSIALAVGFAFGSGIFSLVSGRPEQWPVFALHGMAGLWLLLLLWGKLRRVLPRLLDPRRRDRATLFGTAALIVVALALGSGLWWVFGGDLFVAGFNLLNWHILLGIGLTLAVSAHMIARAKPLRGGDIHGRRRMLHASALILGGAALWTAQQSLGRRHVRDGALGQLCVGDRLPLELAGGRGGHGAAGDPRRRRGADARPRRASTPRRARPARLRMDQMGRAH